MASLAPRGNERASWYLVPTLTPRSSGSRLSSLSHQSTEPHSQAELGPGWQDLPEVTRDVPYDGGSAWPAAHPLCVGGQVPGLTQMEHP